MIKVVALLVTLLLSLGVLAQGGDLLSKAGPAGKWRVIELHSGKCEDEGQRVMAIHEEQGVLEGCWVQALRVIVIRWKDGDASFVPASVFFPQEQKS